MANNQSSLPPPFPPPGYLEEYIGQGPVSVGIVSIVLEVRLGRAPVLGQVYRPSRVGNGRYLDYRWCDAMSGCHRLLFRWADGSRSITEDIGRSHQCWQLAPASVYHGGVGLSLGGLRLDVLSFRKKWTLILPLMCMPAVIVPKLAILFLYRRIFTNRVERIACWVIGALMVANCVGSMIGGLFICIPLGFFVEQNHSWGSLPRYWCMVSLEWCHEHFQRCGDALYYPFRSYGGFNCRAQSN